MDSNCSIISLFFFFLLTLQSHLVTSSHSRSIIKNLPGFSGDLPFTLETGYIGVGKDEAVQAFYYFVESERNPSKDPLVYYLDGGPGSSALYPFLYQIGPLQFNYEYSWRENITLELNPNSWTKTMNLLLVDLPTGTGFSYAKTWEASRSSDSNSSIVAYDFLRKWLVKHPRFLSNPLYVTGISYMGIILPVVTLEVYNGNERGNQPHLNIKGYLIVSPLTDKFIDFNTRVKFAHRLALISDDIYESAKETCNGNYISYDLENTLCSNNLQHVDECISRIYLGNVLEPYCDDPKPDPVCGEKEERYVVVWANDKDVQRALNIREGTIGTWDYQNTTIHYMFQKNDTICYAYDINSTISYHKELSTKNCKSFIISGDHDMTFPYIGVQEWISTLNLSIESPWAPWFVDTQVAGYETTYVHNEYSLKHATIKGAGHSVALYKPKETFITVDRWLASDTYSSDS